MAAASMKCTRQGCCLRGAGSMGSMWCWMDTAEDGIATRLTTCRAPLFRILLAFGETLVLFAGNAMAGAGAGARVAKRLVLRSRRHRRHSDLALAPLSFGVRQSGSRSAPDGTPLEGGCGLWTRPPHFWHPHPVSPSVRGTEAQSLSEKECCSR